MTLIYLRRHLLNKISEGRAWARTRTRNAMQFIRVLRRLNPPKSHRLVSENKTEADRQQHHWDCTPQAKPATKHENQPSESNEQKGLPDRRFEVIREPTSKRFFWLQKALRQTVAAEEVKRSQPYDEKQSHHRQLSPIRNRESRRFREQIWRQCQDQRDRADGYEWPNSTNPQPQPCTAVSHCCFGHRCKLSRIDTRFLSFTRKLSLKSNGILAIVWLKRF